MVKVLFIRLNYKLREKIAEYEQMKAESAEYERMWQEQSKRADHVRAKFRVVDASVDRIARSSMMNGMHDWIVIEILENC